MRTCQHYKVAFRLQSQQDGCVPAILPLRLAVVLVPFVLLAACVDAVRPPVELGVADGFALLAGAGITNTGSTTVTGDVGSFPTPAQTGFGPGADAVILLPPSVNHFDDSVTKAAKDDLVTAYDAAAGAGPASPIAADLGGQTLMAGVYADNNAPDSLSVTGTLTLDGGGDPESVFIFQSGSTLILAAGSNVVLIHGAQACHIFWQVTSSATLGTSAHLQGTILALQSITLNTGAVVEGRALARNGALTMDSNAIHVDSCAHSGTQTTPATTSIPVFPTSAALVVACFGAVGGAYLVWRKRR